MAYNHPHQNDLPPRHSRQFNRPTSYAYVPPPLRHNAAPSPAPAAGGGAATGGGGGGGGGGFTTQTQPYYGNAAPAPQRFVAPDPYYPPAYPRFNNHNTTNHRFDPRQPTRPSQYQDRARGGRGRSAGQGRGGGGGGGRIQSRGGGGGGGYYHQYVEPVYQEQNPFDNVADKFDELNVTTDKVVSAGGGGADLGIIDFDNYENIPVQSSGDDVPPPVNTFAEIDLGSALKDNISRCKYVKPTPIQRHAIPIVVAGRDLMACAQTGSGKTAAFCFPIISGISKTKQAMPAADSMPAYADGGDVRIASPIALILSPTRELSCQIHDEAKKFAYQTGVKIVVAYGGAPISHQFRNLERGVDILVATPGRLVDMIERERVSLSKLKYLTLDEADRMLDMGFEPQIRKIVEQLDMPRTGARQTMLFSATFPDEIQRLAADFLSNYIFLSVGRVGSSTDRISQSVEYVEDMNKRSHLMQILHSQRQNGSHGKHALMLVFVETKRSADSLEHWLFENGFPATAIHGDKVQMERERALRSFKSGATPIMVATDVAARGLDISHVSHVINFDMPKSIDDYVHRIGRTGRAGKSGYATAFFNEGNGALAKPLVELMQEANQEVPEWLTHYAEKSSYFGKGGSGGRSSAYRNNKGSSKFGGHDYRNDYHSTSYNDVQYPAAAAYEGGNGYAAPPPVSYDPYGNGSSYASYQVDIGSVVATGWD